MDASFREQMEASLRNQMDASQLNHLMMDSSDASHYDGGGRRSMTAASINPNASQDQEALKEALLDQIVNPYIEDDSPAAEALRANAQIHIGKMSKVARSINAQAIRKIVKRASMRGHFGNVKGKPPRALPNQMQTAPDADINAMSIVQEEDGGSDIASSSALDLGESDSEDNNKMGTARDSEKDRMSSSEKSMSISTREGAIAAAQRSGADNYNKNGLSNVVTKRSPSIINKYPGDHLHYSLQAMEKQAKGIEELVPTSEQKDIPQEVVDGTMEAGRKGKVELVSIRYVSARAKTASIRNR